MRVILSLIFVTLVSLLLATQCNSCGPLSQSRIEACFRENKADITIVKEFLADLEYPIIRLSSTSPHYQMWISGIGNVTIEDDEVAAAIGRLREAGSLGRRRYRVISKGDNLIEFQRWSTLDASRGVLYSIDGSDPNEWRLGLPATLIEVIPLSEPGWFYFVSNTIVWNERNRQWQGPRH